MTFGSFPCFDPLSSHCVRWLAPSSLIDLGAGTGKYGRIAREVAPACLSTAVDHHPQAVSHLAAQGAYAAVHQADALEWVVTNGSSAFDLAVLGDCLHWMPRSQGMDLLHALVYRCAWVMISAPEFTTAPGADAPAQAPPLSVWSERDFHWADRWAWDNCRTVTWLLLRGYRAASKSLEQAVGELNDARLPVLDFDGATTVRPARLRMVEHPREVNYRGY